MAKGRMLKKRKNRKRIPNWLRREVIKKSGLKCFYCGKEGFIDKSRPLFPVVLEKEPYKDHGYSMDYFILRHRAMHIDHIIPISKGGKTELSNLVLACESCNESKKAKTLKDWKNNARR